jgi:cell division protein FtsQ
VIAGAIVVVLIAVWVVAFSSLLGVRTVVVSGTHSVTADQVRSAAAIGHGAPLIRLDTAAVRVRVESIPDVASASVSVSYPSTVRIAITERVAVGYVPVGNNIALVDKSGVQYRELATPPTGLPRFTLPTGAQAQPSGHAVAVVAGALGAPLLAKLATIGANDPQSITLVLRDGRIVTWGSADRSAAKAKLLTALLTRPGTRIDVSNPDVVVVR